MTVTHPKRKLTDNLELGIQYNCDGCHDDISGVVRIQCAECAELDLCVECFSEGWEQGAHLKTHAYQVIEPFSFALLEDDWRADEELLLLDGCVSVGLGNWVDIAGHIGTKTADECERHYYDIYVHSPIFPLPHPDKVISEKTFIPLPVGYKRLKEQENVESLQSNPANHDIAGYMPLRFEFETEYENEAENLIKDLVFNEEDTPIDTEVKLALLQQYNDILDKRAERKRFIFDHSLLEFKKVLAVEKARSKEEKELYHQLSLYEKYMSPKDFSVFYHGFLVEHDLRRRIAQLQEYRRNGIRDFHSAGVYEQAKARLSQSSDASLSQPLMKVATPSLKVQAIAPSLSKMEPVIKDSVVSTPLLPSTPRQPLPRRSLGAPLDISDAEGLELLSTKERDLCSILRLQPKLYLSIKETLVTQYQKLGYLKRAQARSLIKIDVNKTSRIYDFFISAGWITPDKKAASSTSR